MDLSVSAANPSLASPCGEDLEYDAEFLALQQAAQGKPEQQFGATIIAAEPANWHEVQRLADSLSQRTQDIRISGYAARAQTGMRGLPGYAQGLAAVVAQLERYWDDIHPSLYIEGEFDPMPRINALQALTDPQEAGREARSARLLNGVHGQLSLRDAEAMLDGSRSDLPSYPGGRPRLLSDLRQAWFQGDAELQAVMQAREALRRIRALVTQHLGEDWAPNYDPMLRTLDVIAQAAQGAPEPAEAGEQERPGASGGEAPASLPTAGAAAPGHAGPVSSREQAMALLTQVCRYFETHEPSHPAPFLLRRVQQTITMDFHELLGNLAPQGLSQFEAWLPKEGTTQASD